MHCDRDYSRKWNKKIECLSHYFTCSKIHVENILRTCPWWMWFLLFCTHALLGSCTMCSYEIFMRPIHERVKTTINATNIVHSCLLGSKHPLLWNTQHGTVRNVKSAQFAIVTCLCMCSALNSMWFRNSFVSFDCASNRWCASWRCTLAVLLSTMLSTLYHQHLQFRND